jgi:hypothetical protein
MKEFTMEYSTPVRVTLEIRSPEDIRVLNEEGTEISWLPPDEIRKLYERAGGIRHYGEMLYDDLGTRVAAEGCWLYVHLNCRWVKVPVPCA